MVLCETILTSYLQPPICLDNYEKIVIFTPFVLKLQFTQKAISSLFYSCI